MTELYNLTPFYDAENMIMLIGAINMTTGNLFISGLYIVIGFGMMAAIYFGTRDIVKSLALGGFIAGIVGFPLAILEWMPIYFPFLFLVMCLIGVVLRIAIGRTD
jgi:hypothetical protein